MLTRDSESASRCSLKAGKSGLWKLRQRETPSIKRWRSRASLRPRVVKLSAKFKSKNKRSSMKRSTERPNWPSAELISRLLLESLI